MGCGQSKIHLYPRKSKSKANGKKSGHIDPEADADDDEGHHNDREKDCNKNEEKHNENNFHHQNSLHHDGTHSPEPPNGEIPLPLWWPQLEHRNKGLSSSQQDFFRILDQKIENGPDYDSHTEREAALEDIRISGLLERWESASITASLCSSNSRSLQNTPVRQHVNLSPKRGGGGGGSATGIDRNLLSQTVIHQSYGVVTQQENSVQNSRKYWSMTPLIRMPQQPQQPPHVGPYPKQPQGPASLSPQPPHSPQLPLASSMQQQQQQHQQQTSHQQQQHQEPRFPPAISVQRLAPQVQRQIRETQELIKESCPQRYTAGYGSPGPPMRAQPRPPRRPLETHYSQELS